MVAGVAGALNVYLMSVANLVGFAVGVDGIYDILHSALNINGVYFLIGSFACVFAAVQIMFEWRVEEWRHSGKMKNY
jgi:inner membrane protein involved in colicin E2 resistance